MAQSVAAWESRIETVIRQCRPYNNISEIQRKMPKDFFDPIDAEELVGWIRKGFRENPPGMNPKRDLLFTAMDMAAVASDKDKYAPLVALWGETTWDVYRQLRKPAEPGRLILYKLYNEGAVIRAPGLCIGIDIVLPSRDDRAGPGLAELLDALFISHSDRDHYDPQSSLVTGLEKAGKPVIVAKDDETVAVGGVLKSGRVAGLEWTSFRGGHLNGRFSSFYHFKIGDWSILHSGDNTAWLAPESPLLRNVDIFFLKPESVYVVDGKWQGGVQTAMEESLRKLRPRLVIPHHLLEVGHRLDAYGHDMGIRLRNQVPEGTRVQMLQWGESLSFSFQRKTM